MEGCWEEDPSFYPFGGIVMICFTPDSVRYMRNDGFLNKAKYIRSGKNLLIEYEKAIYLESDDENLILDGFYYKRFEPLSLDFFSLPRVQKLEDSLWYGMNLILSTKNGAEIYFRIGRNRSERKMSDNFFMGKHWVGLSERKLRIFADQNILSDRFIDFMFKISYYWDIDQFEMFFSYGNELIPLIVKPLFTRRQYKYFIDLNRLPPKNINEYTFHNHEGNDVFMSLVTFGSVQDTIRLAPEMPIGRLVEQMGI